MASEATEVKDPKKPPYPKSVFFIIGNEFCERFCYYGLRTLLFLYLKNVLLYSSDDATAINHGFMFLSYFFPLMGAILADSFLGKYRTILYLSMVYSLGCIVLSLGSVNAFGIPAKELSLLGLVLIAIGTGGIKPCVSAFGGDQFILPQQQKQLETFFSVFYFSINLGSVISTYLTPFLKKDVACFDANTCYPLAFGIPSALMIVSTVIFVLGKPFYSMKKPGRNIILEVICCVKDAIVQKIRGSQEEKKEHWLDYASNKHDAALISDVKALMAVLHMFLPVPIFWALYDQQTSRWIAQAELMNGKLGSWTLLPEQMQALNPLLILTFIPIFNFAIYPALSAIGLLKKPLQRLGAGGLLAALAFVVSALIEYKVEATSAVLPQAGEGQLRIFNSLNCSIALKSNDTDEKIIKTLDAEFFLSIKVSGERTLHFEAMSNCFNTSNKFSGNLHIHEKKSTSYMVVQNGTGLTFKPVPGPDRIAKSVDQVPIVRVIYEVKKDIMVDLRKVGNSRSLKLKQGSSEIGVPNLDQNSYQVYVDGKPKGGVFEIYNGGVYTLMIVEIKNEMFVRMFEITPGNTVHILWQLPQIIIITIAEVMFSITGLQFAFTQAPLSMKSVVASLWLLTTALGNVIVAVVAESHLFASLANELLLFAGLMLIDMVIFILLAMRYKYKYFNEE